MESAKKAGEEKPKADEVITVKLVPQDGGETVEIRAKKGTKIEKLIGAWANQRSIAAGSVRLAFEGRPLLPSATLAEAGIEHEDQVDVFLQQLGGFMA